MKLDKMEKNYQDFLSENGLGLLNKIFLSAGEGIILVDASGKIKLVNKRTEEIFEYGQNELSDHAIEDLIPKRYHHTHVVDRAEYIKNPISRPMGIGKHLTGLKKSGKEFPVEVSLSYVSHEEKIFVVAFVSDITMRKEQQDAIEASRKKLEENTAMLELKVKERTRELEHLNLGLNSQIHERRLAENALKESLRELKKAEAEILSALEKEKELNELKSRFISMASHEFRTPLTTILSSANLIGKYADSSQQEHREKHIHRIQTSVQNLTNILNDFLSLEKLESGTISLKSSTFQLSMLLDEIHEEFSTVLKEKQQLEIKNEIDTLHTDPYLVKNILINLISNAIKYSPSGTKIAITATSDGDHARIAVLDQGIGIPKKEHIRLFERFYRAENATNFQGTGLGLNIVKRYLSLINGEITFQSEEGKGSTFTIIFPKNVEDQFLDEKEDTSH